MGLFWVRLGLFFLTFGAGKLALVVSWKRFRGKSSFLDLGLFSQKKFNLSNVFDKCRISRKMRFLGVGLPHVVVIVFNIIVVSHIISKKRRFVKEFTGRKCIKNNQKYLT